MTRYLLLYMAFLLAGCAGTKFSYVTDKRVQEYGPLKPFRLKEDYQLYVRQVIKVYDSARRIYVPENGTVSAGTELIEIEYLLISKDAKSAIVINNIPNKRYLFYNSEDKRADLADTAQQLKIDVWYFNQFRFGSVNGNGDLVFKDAGGSGKDHIWNLTRAGDDMLEIDAVSVSDQFGEDKRWVEAAFALKMIFRKAEDFVFLFKNNAGNKKHVDQTFLLKEQTLAVANRNGSWFIVFAFDTPVFKHYPNVVFFNERVYAGLE